MTYKFNADRFVTPENGFGSGTIGDLIRKAHPDIEEGLLPDAAGVLSSRGHNESFLGVQRVVLACVVNGDANGITSTEEDIIRDLAATGHYRDELLWALIGFRAGGHLVLDEQGNVYPTFNPQDKAA